MKKTVKYILLILLIMIFGKFNVACFDDKPINYYHFWSEFSEEYNLNEPITMKFYIATDEVKNQADGYNEAEISSINGNDLITWQEEDKFFKNPFSYEDRIVLVHLYDYNEDNYPCKKNKEDMRSIDIELSKELLIGSEGKILIVLKDRIIYSTMVLYYEIKDNIVYFSNKRINYEHFCLEFSEEYDLNEPIIMKFYIATNEAKNQTEGYNEAEISYINGSYLPTYQEREKFCENPSSYEDRIVLVHLYDYNKENYPYRMHRKDMTSIDFEFSKELLTGSIGSIYLVLSDSSGCANKILYYEIKDDIVCFYYQLKPISTSK